MDNMRFSNIRDVDKYVEGLSAQADAVCKEGLAYGEKLSDAGAYSDGKDILTDECETLNTEERMAEFFYLGLRRMDGVQFSEFEDEFGVSAFEVYGEVIKGLVVQGLLEYIIDDKVTEESIFGTAAASSAALGVRLSSKGIFLSNRVFMEFV